MSNRDDARLRGRSGAALSPRGEQTSDGPAVRLAQDLPAPWGTAGLCATRPLNRVFRAKPIGHSWLRPAVAFAAIALRFRSGVAKGIAHSGTDHVDPAPRSPRRAVAATSSAAPRSSV